MERAANGSDGSGEVVEEDPGLQSHRVRTDEATECFGKDDGLLPGSVP